MTTIRAYHRPATLDDALVLLAQPDVVPLGGGTTLNGLPAATPAEVVDLQALGLDEITRDGAALRIGAMVRLQDLIDHEWLPPLLKELAHREAPNTIRNAATIGGTVAAADAESELLAGLLAHGAGVTVARPAGSVDIGLADLLADPSELEAGLITAIHIIVGGNGAAARTGRTPADTPIVMVAGVCDDASNVRLAATGVADTPVLIDLDALDDLDPPPDFRGSAEYRRALAGTLGARVVAELKKAGAG
jgi:probable selenate reductase FAD-binding subunit